MLIGSTIVLGGIGSFIMLGTRDVRHADIEDRCRAAISMTLKAPSTAQFSGVSVFREEGDIYAVTGLVDSQNSFGAMLRHGFECKIRQDMSGTIKTVSACVTSPERRCL